VIKSLLKASVQFSRRLQLRCQGAAITSPRLLASGIDCRRGVGASGAGRIEIAPGAWIELGVVLHAFGGDIRIGRDTFLGPYTVIYGHGGVEIGDHTLISMHCCILSSNHTVPPRGMLIRSQPDLKQPTKIGRDVWLGAGVTVLGGVTIGDGCVVGAGAVVSRDLPPCSIALGVPAVVVRRRE
jgi:acetyltransferase-like isoleucine patch superfamily enzyme